MSLDQFFRENPDEAREILTHTDQGVIEELVRSGKYPEVLHPDYEVQFYKQKLENQYNKLFVDSLIWFKIKFQISWPELVNITESFFASEKDPRLRQALLDQIVEDDNEKGLRLLRHLIRPAEREINRSRAGIYPKAMSIAWPELNAILRQKQKDEAMRKALSKPKIRRERNE